MSPVLLSYVRLLEGLPSWVRGERVEGVLASMGLYARRESFRWWGKQGTNIVVDIGDGEAFILASAHYDIYRRTPGANDNASGVAALLGCAARWRDYQPRHTIRLVFFDGEEPTFRLGPIRLGTAGSAAYVRRHSLAGLLAVYNLEFCGEGDTLALWPVSPEDRGRGVDNAVSTLRGMGSPYAVAPVPPWLFSSDHHPFRRHGFKDALTLSVVPSHDAEGLRRFVASPWAPLRLNFGHRSQVPDFFRRMHTSGDTSEYLSEAALQLASEAVYRMVINLDRG